MLLLGIALYYLPVRTIVLYPVMTFVGLFLIIRSVSVIFGKGAGSVLNAQESFPQCEKNIPTPYSVNLAYNYKYEGKTRSG